MDFILYMFMITMVQSEVQQYGIRRVSLQAESS